ncbi:ABC transporter permease [Finegoldia magna]|uniref:ABC transporter permease n=2 Tax=Finegoldia magna TaxID=1260 RepID=UPI0012B05F09|nr:ABC transporter permease [Finegoldia magna]MSB16564.1 hypothetical protein [Finegoldia magna]MSD45351.1 hypothetical protein [Finegoldia magna]
METYQLIKAIFMKNLAMSRRYKIDTLALIFRPLLTMIPYIFLGNYVFKTGVSDNYSVINIENYKAYIIISLVVINLTTNGIYLAMEMLEDEIQRGNIENLLASNVKVNKYFFVEIFYRYLGQIFISGIILIACIVLFQVNFIVIHKGIFILVMVLSLLFSFGLGFILTGFTMKTKMTRLAYMILSFIMFLSGELYPITSFPLVLKILSYLNPLTYILDLTRFCVIDTSTYLNIYFEILVCTLLGLFVLLFGRKKFTSIIFNLKNNGKLTMY